MQFVKAAVKAGTACVERIVYRIRKRRLIIERAEVSLTAKWQGENMSWTRAQIKEKIKYNQRCLERAIVAIYKRQTIDKQYTESLGLDTRYLACCAKWLLKGKPLPKLLLRKLLIESPGTVSSLYRLLIAGGE